MDAWIASNWPISSARAARRCSPKDVGLARGLHLSLAERDYLFRITGNPAPDRLGDLEHVSPGMLRILDRLQDTPAQAMGETGEALVQTPLAVALLGTMTNYSGLARSMVYRWFTDPAARAVYHPDDHATHGQAFVAELRGAFARGGEASRAARLVAALDRESAEFRQVWAEHRVADKHVRTKRFVNAQVGELTLDCETLDDPATRQRLLVFTATPGSESAERLELLAVLGARFSDRVSPSL